MTEYYWGRPATLDELVGKVLTSVRQNSDDAIMFTTEDGSEYKMYHEPVLTHISELPRIVEVVGDLSDLVNTSLDKAEWLGVDETLHVYFYTYKGLVSVEWYIPSLLGVDFVKMKAGTIGDK